MKAPDIFANRLLNALPLLDSQAIRPLLSVVDLAQGIVVMPAGEDAKFVYFPLSGMISLVMVMLDGRAIETATVGREGGVGLMSAFGTHHANVRAIIQLPTVAARMTASAFLVFASAHPAIYTMALAYNELLLKQATVTAACNGLHHIEARFCRWILQTRDCAENDVIPLTQEFLSEMLGVRRTSVTEVACRMQALGLISYARGTITVRDVEALKKLSCECYEALRIREMV
jgi:CRP-like cAMP-binding protein